MYNAISDTKSSSYIITHVHKSCSAIVKNSYIAITVYYYYVNAMCFPVCTNSQRPSREECSALPLSSRYVVPSAGITGTDVDHVVLSGHWGKDTHTHTSLFTHTYLH